MSDLGNKVQTLVEDIKQLTLQLGEKKKELGALQTDLRNQLKEVASLTGQRVVTGPGRGRPKGSAVPDGELSVSQKVLRFLIEAGDKGASRAEILALVPGRDAAVHAAIRVHQVAGKIRNDKESHRWFCVPAAVTADDTNTEPEITVTEGTVENTVA